MNQQSMRNLTLFDLLARSWDLPSSSEAVRFSADGNVAAFACADGTIAIARLADAEPPEKRIRVSADLGQATIRPRERAPAPLIVTESLCAGAPPVVRFGQSAFLVGGDGGVRRVTAAGDVESAVPELDGPIVALDHADSAGITAASNGSDIVLSDGHGRSERLATPDGVDLAALAFSPSGGQLAVCGRSKLSIWTVEGGPSPACMFDLPGRPLQPRWSADGGWLACPLEPGGFTLIDVAGGRIGTIKDFPARTRTVSWSVPANALVASGAFRIAGWSMDEPPLVDAGSGALVTGRAGLVIVEAVAAHPGRPLVAAGYASGQIVVAQIGAHDELLIKPAGGAVTVLNWSVDGRHLAAGTADGKASLITFPAQLFK